MNDPMGKQLPPLYAEMIEGRTARTMLLLHGGGVGGWMWKPLIKHLGHEWTYLVPDLPGHDHSAEQPYRSHQQTVDSLASLLENKRCGSVTVVGFSLGAQLAVLLASQRPDLIDGAVVISAQAKPAKWPSATLALLSVAAPLAKSERFARAQAQTLFVPPDLFSDYLRTSQLLSKNTLLGSVGENIKFTIPPGWASFSGDALVLVGKSERKMMRDSANYLAQAHAGNEAETVDGCGHGIPLQEPGWLAERLKAWLR